MAYDYYGFQPYVSVAQRRARAKREMAKLEKQGKQIEPIEIEGRKIARTFWGQAWCDHLESFSDYANRLPRGRSYVKNGSVCHLVIRKGHIEAIVSGSELYNVTVQIATLPKKKWSALKKQCTGQIGSLLELLSGELSDNLLQVVTDRKQGLFPLPGEIKFSCDCPDWASMCKHIAAVLYGVGARLDHSPGLLFELRGVDVEELIEADTETALDTNLDAPGGKQLANEDLSDIFGIDMAPPAESPPASSKKPKKRTKTTKAAKKTTKKKSAKKKATKKKKTTPKKSAKKKTMKKKKATKKKSAKKKTVNKKSTKKKTTSQAKTSAKKAKTRTKRKSTKRSSKKKKSS